MTKSSIKKSHDFDYADFMIKVMGTTCVIFTILAVIAFAMLIFKLV